MSDEDRKIISLRAWAVRLIDDDDSLIRDSDKIKNQVPTLSEKVHRLIEERYVKLACQ